MGVYKRGGRQQQEMGDTKDMILGKHESNNLLFRQMVSSSTHCHTHHVLKTIVVCSIGGDNDSPTSQVVGVVQGTPHQLQGHEVVASLSVEEHSIEIGRAHV